MPWYMVHDYYMIQGTSKKEEIIPVALYLLFDSLSI